MANTKQAKKRIVQNIKKHQHNKAIISRQRTELKKLITMLQVHTKEAVDTNSDIFKTQLQLVIKLTDSAVNKGVYHRNKAARIKSRLFARIHKYVSDNKEVTVQVRSSEQATILDSQSTSTSNASESVPVDTTQSY